MLDLVEHVVDWSRSAPILLLCIARPELLDVRPGWGGGKLNATSVLLEPLADAGGAPRCDGAARRRRARRGDARAHPRRPPRATRSSSRRWRRLRARRRRGRRAADDPARSSRRGSTRSNDDERVVVERGAVEGQVFHRGAVDGARARDAARVRRAAATRWRSSARRSCGPTAALIPGDDAFRFRHLLIRDTAYEALPKAVRAELHERFADWLDANAQLVRAGRDRRLPPRAGSPVPVGARPRRPACAELGARAAERLGAAGRAAFEREDLHATRNLLRAGARAPAGGADRAARACSRTSSRPVSRRTSGDEADALLEELEAATTPTARSRRDPGDRQRPERPAEILLAGLDGAQAVLAATGDVVGARALRAGARAGSTGVLPHEPTRVGVPPRLRAARLGRGDGRPALATSMFGLCPQRASSGAPRARRSSGSSTSSRQRAGRAGPCSWPRAALAAGTRSRYSMAGIEDSARLARPLEEESALLDAGRGYDVAEAERRADRHPDARGWLGGTRGGDALAHGDAEASSGLGSLYHANIARDVGLALCDARRLPSGRSRPSQRGTCGSQPARTSPTRSCSTSPRRGRVRSRRARARVAPPRACARGA